jgi:hypothetical protein
MKETKSRGCQETTNAKENSGVVSRQSKSTSIKLIRRPFRSFESKPCLGSSICHCEKLLLQGDWCPCAQKRTEECLPEGRDNRRPSKRNITPGGQRFFRSSPDELLQGMRDMCREFPGYRDSSQQQWTQSTYVAGLIPRQSGEEYYILLSVVLTNGNLLRLVTHGE